MLMKEKVEMSLKGIKFFLNNFILSSSYKDSTIEIQRKITLISLINLIGIINLSSLGITAYFQNNIAYVFLIYLRDSCWLLLKF